MAELFSADPALSGSPDFRVPHFTLVISPESIGGWHAAAIVRKAASPAFFLRSISTPWPFVVARPKPSTRQSGLTFRPDELSPVRSSPMQKLAVNWAWEQADNDTEQLRFYVRRRGMLWLWPKRRLAVRLGLKHHLAPDRRVAVQLRSELIDWRPGREEAFVPAGSSSPAQG